MANDYGGDFGLLNWVSTTHLPFEKMPRTQDMEPAQIPTAAAPILPSELSTPLSSTPSNNSDVSTSPSGSASSWRAFVVAQQELVASNTGASTINRLSPPGRITGDISPSSRFQNPRPPSHRAVRNPVTKSMSANPNLRVAPRRPRTSYSPAHQPIDPSIEHLMWRSWKELQVKVFGLPPDTHTRDVVMWFQDEGLICCIEIFRAPPGFSGLGANILFRPPPTKPFWEAQRRRLWRGATEIGFCQIRLVNRPNFCSVPSPTRDDMTHQEVLTMRAKTLDFGMMIDEESILGMGQVTTTAKTPITFQQNLFYRELHIGFRLPIQDWRSSRPGGIALRNLGKHNREEDYKFKIPFRDLKDIREIAIGPESFALVMSLKTPPKFFKRVDDPRAYDDHSRVWKDENTWFRQTDIVYNPSALKRLPLSLQKLHTILDLGRWTTYRIVFDKTDNDKRIHQQIRRALCDFGVNIIPCPNLELVDRKRPAVWEHVNRTSQNGDTAGGALSELAQTSVPYLSFRIRYQLEVCISYGILNEYSLGRDFVMRLAEMQPVAAQDLLETVANLNKPLYTPMSVFDIKPVSGSSSSTKIPDSCISMRSATITPTTIYFHNPTVETSNRVIRYYSEHTDRFLRVRFTDEKSEGRIFSTTSDTNNEVFTRVKRTLSNGIRVGDRHYEFLAFGNSQFREHGAYFFAPTAQVDAKRIRMWMGSFQDIRTVAKYASRLGQCFSTTRAITSFTPHIVELRDIYHNRFCFSDGVGRISPLLARLAASELGILQATQEAPSIFQFRLGGCKGVLAVCPTSKPRELHLRCSQYKFPASHEGLEIIKWSRFACAKLNQQLILVLSSLGVQDGVFKGMMQLQLNDLERAMQDSGTALSLLTKYVDHNQMTLTLASMVIDGFQDTDEPFTLALLQLWRAWSTKYLKEKAQIAVGRGALLLGCVDETDSLRGHYDNLHDNMLGPEASIGDRARGLPQIFVQISKDPDHEGKVEPRVILGPMILARNPSLHAGDIRVVCGVDVPELHHLIDAVVLPQNGDRDLASMCSGGDLDGDDYLVIWDQNLLPREWNHQPMDYSAPELLRHEGDITVDDLTTFFVTYMKNDCLGHIATAHRAWADWSEDGVKDSKCIELASLHSKAVDYPKTGQPARMTKDLHAPKSPHFMQRKSANRNNTYVSRKILGQLYDQVERTDFSPDLSRSFNRTILDAYTPSEETLSVARRIKKEYDAALCCIMAKSDVKTEFEIWSTFALGHNNLNDFKFHEEIGQLSANLKVRYRKLCLEAAGGDQHDQLAPFVAAMYQVTAEETAAAVAKCNETHVVEGNFETVERYKNESMPKISFPWLFHDVLGKIANPTTMSSYEELQAEAVTQHHNTTSTPRRGRNIDRGKALLPDLTTAQGVVHQGDLFEPFTSQNEQDLERDGDEHVVRPTADELSTAIQMASQDSVPLPSQALKKPVIDTAGSSLASIDGDPNSRDKASDHGIQIAPSSDGTDDLIKLSGQASPLDLSVVGTELPRIDDRVQASYVDSLKVVSVDSISDPHNSDAVKNTELEVLDVVDNGNNEKEGISYDGDMDDMEEEVVQITGERRCVNKLLEAFSSQEEDEQDKDDLDEEVKLAAAKR